MDILKDAPPPAVAASTSTSGSMDGSNWSDTLTVDDAIAMEHRALHRFMTNLLTEASVSALHTFLIQDNASILTKSASLSARAAHKRFFLGKDHLITKEISRWESYPFEVDQPIVVNRPKKAKNGCVPQRRAKRRSGLESAGEIKADIAKKAASLPRAPRRRSSVRTDDAQKANMQEELLSVFQQGMDGSHNNNSASRMNSEKPRRELSPHRWATPKKPIRRISEVPEDLTAIYHSSPGTRMGSGDLSLMDSQHSSASTESTLSELAARSSDLSSVSESSDLLAAFSVIPEEHEEQSDVVLLAPANNGGRLKRNNSSQTNSKKPMRRVSEIPADPLGGVAVSPKRDSESTLSSSASDSLSSASLPPLLPKPDKLPALARVKSVELDDMEKDDEEDNEQEPPPRRIPQRTASAPVKLSNASPRKPTRRPSEVPDDIIHDMRKEHQQQQQQQEQGDNNGKRHGTEAEAATAENWDERPSHSYCTVIPEEEDAPTAD